SLDNIDILKYKYSELNKKISSIEKDNDVVVWIPKQEKQEMNKSINSKNTNIPEKKKKNNKNKKRNKNISKSETINSNNSHSFISDEKNCDNNKSLSTKESDIVNSKVISNERNEISEDKINTSYQNLGMEKKKSKLDLDGNNIKNKHSITHEVSSSKVQKSNINQSKVKDNKLKTKTSKISPDFKTEKINTIIKDKKVENSEEISKNSKLPKLEIPNEIDLKSKEENLFSSSNSNASKTEYNSITSQYDSLHSLDSINNMISKPKKDKTIDIGVNNFSAFNSRSENSFVDEKENDIIYASKEIGKKKIKPVDRNQKDTIKSDLSNIDNFSSISQTKNRYKNDNNISNNLQFSRVKFNDNTHDIRNPLGGKDYKTLLKKVQSTQQDIEALKSSNLEMAQEKENKLSTSKAIKKAYGLKLKDDPERLKKAAQNKEKQRLKSKKKFEEREANIIKRRKEKQIKRMENIKRHKSKKI
ncbi:MAG: surfeit locus protein, partial [Paramarteilia canceri]